MKPGKVFNKSSPGKGLSANRLKEEGWGGKDSANG